ncbi:unnamed protein product [Mytilus coruscus]|uniref:CCHC-type domain-containing protein n=1 Tax=Mytilus coruscus TaxID=42192 RepID=A0A6J8AZM7_MYTCO|nr:unnamed protein product [Mytilus coruscus]
MAYSMDYASGISQHEKAKIEHSDRFLDKDEVKYRHEKDFNFSTPLKSFVTLSETYADSVRDKSILKTPDYKVDRKFTPKRYQEPHFSRRPSYDSYDDRDRLNKNQGSDYPPNNRYVDKDTFSKDYQPLNRGLNNLDLQKHVQFQRANTLDTAISYAIEYEAFINPQNNIRKPMLTNNEVPIQAIKDNKKESSTSHTESLTLDQVAKLIDEKLSQLKTGTENRNGYYQNRPPRFNNRGRGRYYRNQNSTTDRVCYKCNEIGHIQYNSIEQSGKQLKADLEVNTSAVKILERPQTKIEKNSSYCSRIQIARHVSIPAKSEMIIEASKRDSFVDDIGIIEPLDWVKIKLKQGEQIAHLMTIEQIFNEDNTESQIDSKSDDISEQVNTLKDIDMPEHLKSMLDKVSSDLKDEEKQKLFTYT